MSLKIIVCIFSLRNYVDMYDKMKLMMDKINIIKYVLILFLYKRSI